MAADLAEAERKEDKRRLEAQLKVRVMVWRWRWCGFATVCPAPLADTHPLMFTCLCAAVSRQELQEGMADGSSGLSEAAREALAERARDLPQEQLFEVRRCDARVSLGGCAAVCSPGGRRTGEDLAVAQF
jgi:hypothetical protein